MAVFRVEKNRNYTVMSNYHLRDKNLSLRSIALLSIMLSLPEDWDYSLRGLAKICKDGRDAIGNSLKELEKNGYLKREQKRDAHGRLSDIEYTVYEYPSDIPCPENPDTVIPDTGVPDTASPDTEEPYPVNPPEQNIDINNNINKQSKDIPKTNKEKSKIKSISLSVSEPEKEKKGWTDGSYERRSEIRKILEQQLGVGFILKKNRQLEQQLESGEISQTIYDLYYEDMSAVAYVLDIMTDCLSGDPEKPVKINGEDVPRVAVRDRLMKIGKDQLLSVLQSIRARGGQIRNKRAYIISSLYNEGPASLKGPW